MQNNLQELVVSNHLLLSHTYGSLAQYETSEQSLLNFILPEVFDEAEEYLRQIFKVHAKGVVNLLSQQRVSRARTMMTPFVLRRRKAQVLKDLPKRTDRVQHCKMTASQRFLYDQSLRRSRTLLMDDDKQDDGEEKSAPRKGKKDVNKPAEDSSNNVLMDLRKATNHPLLFRRVYTDALIKVVARDCMNEPDFVDSNYDMIVEDMSVSTNQAHSH